MIECPICGAENEPEAGSCQSCGFGLSLLGPTILDGASVAIAPASVWPPPVQAGLGEGVGSVSADATPEGKPAIAAEVPLLDPVAPPTVPPVQPPTGGDVLAPTAPDRPAPTEEVPATPAAGADVSNLLKTLRSREPYYVRLGALRQLGRLETSTPEIVRELLLARGLDDWTGARDLAVREVSQLAARLLDASPHQEILQQHPELVEAVAAELRRRAPWRKDVAQPTAPAPETKERASAWGLLGDVVDVILSLLKLFFD